MEELPSGPDGSDALPAQRDGAKQRALRHFEERAARYEETVTRGLLRHLRDRERRAVLELAALLDPATRTVVDVGCGAGYYARLAKGAGKYVHAIDVAPAMVERVRAHVDRAEVGDLDALDPAGRLYDLVLCCGVLDFVDDPSAAFANLARLCAPGGRLVLLLPRAGLGGLLYRLEKRFAGIATQQYRLAWLVERAREVGLALGAVRYPLPWNMVVRLDARG